VERTRHRGLPVTTVARTLLDFASVAPLDRVRRAVAEAEYLRLLDLEAIDPLLGRGRAGSATLRKALQRHRPQYARTLSPLEDRFLDLCQGYEIPLPEVNVIVAGFKVDAVWRDRRLVVELDGAAAHDTSPRMERDRDRELALRSAGFVVLRYTWRQVTTHPAEIAADLRRALANPVPSPDRLGP
jgi:REase_MTES_1575